MMTSARRAAIWLAALAVLVIAGDHVLAAVLRQVLVRSQFRYSRLYRGGNRADILILGDSRGVHSFYAPALEQMTGRRVLNLSYNSMSPRVAEAVLLDYLERNPAPRMVIIETTCVIVTDVLATELRTYGGFSPRLAALYAHEHPVAAAAGRIFHLYPLNSEFYLEAVHYMRRSDQDWINQETMPPALRVRKPGGFPVPQPEQLDALARVAELLRQRGIELRLVLAPYSPLQQPQNAPDFIAAVEQRTGARVWNYVGALEDLDAFADRVHLNERGSRMLLQMLARDGAFGMTQPAPRF